MAAPVMKRIVFILPGIERSPYLYSTIKHAVDLGARIDVVYCRPAGSTRYKNKKSEIREEVLNFRKCKRNYFKVRFESRKRGQIRTFGPRNEFAKTPRSNHRVHILRSYCSYLRRFPESNFYLRRWKSCLPTDILRWVDKPFVKWFLQTSLAFQLLTWLERRGQPDPGVVEWLRSIKADAVVVSPSNSRNSLESDYLFAARKMGIPTAVPVLSWDNLTTKGLIPFNPDLVLAWNGEHAREAREIHNIAATHIVETGSPFFDKWFDRRDLLQDRDPFVSRLGLNPDHPYLVYLGSSRNIAENEGWLVQRLLTDIKQDPKLSGLQMVVRPHPANDQMVQDLEQEAGMVFMGSELPFSDRSIALLMNTLIHATAVIGVNTSGMVDALALDKPCFSIKTDRYQDTHLDAAHFRHMVDADAVFVAEDSASLLHAISGILEGRDDHRQQRQRFIRKFVRPHGLDTPAGKVAAEAILLLAERKTGAEISAELKAI